MTFKEYINKRVNVDHYIKDDHSDDFVYTVTLRSRQIYIPDSYVVHFYSYPGCLEKPMVDVCCCINVDASYQTGDILKLDNRPFGEDIYMIYGYDEFISKGKYQYYDTKTGL